MSISLNAQHKQIEQSQIMLTPSNSIKFQSLDNWNIGIDIGYFDKKNLAIITGLSYGKLNNVNNLSLKLGAKYYLFNRLPLQFDFSGTIIESNSYHPLYFGVQSGFAFFIGDIR